MKKTLIAPSILSADWTDMTAGMRSIAESGADWVHLDIMDGHFVPNLSFGPAVVKQLRPLCGAPFDVHLMTETPEKWFTPFIQAGADSITFHLEAAVHSHRLVQMIHDAGKKAGIAICPGTPVSALEVLLPRCELVLVMTVNPGFGGQKLIPECLDKVRELCQIRKERGLSFLVSVDGGVNESTATACREAGVDVMVAGSAFFHASDRAAFVKKIAEAA
jgi:ribulose-phosphate 3-epimerase